VLKFKQGLSEEKSHTKAILTVADFVNAVNRYAYKTGVDFHHQFTLRTSFTGADPKSTKKTFGLAVFLAVLGSSHVKR
jgi:hypothetical protein